MGDVKNPNPNAGPNAPGDTGDAQEVDLNDADVSSESVPAQVSAPLRMTPPPLPPMLPTTSQAPPTTSLPPHMSMAPEPVGRGPIFYIGILLAVLVAGAAAGVVVSMRSRSTPPGASPNASASAAPRVITMPVVDMEDTPDAGN
jgi:hypothetical protein